jgi:hypothetical protein
MPAVIKPPTKGVKPKPVPAPVQLVAQDTKSLTPTKVQMKQAQAHVTTKHKDGSGIEETIPVGEPLKFEGPTANVGYALSMTRKLADFENVKLHVSLNMPCEPSGEGIEMAYEFCRSWVDARLDELNEEVNQQLSAD